MTDQDMDKVTAEVEDAAVLNVQVPATAMVGKFPGAGSPAVLTPGGQATGGYPGAGTPTVATTFNPPGL